MGHRVRVAWDIGLRGTTNVITIKDRVRIGWDIGLRLGGT